MEPAVMGWLANYVKPGSTFFDVGANHGFYTVLCSRWVGKGGKVVAFEPSPANQVLLKYHLKANRVKNVEVVPSIVGDRVSESAPFWLVDGGDHSSNSATFGAIQGENVPFMERRQLSEIRVPAISLDALYSKNGLIPDVVKVDVEGGELAVFRGMKQLLADVRPMVVFGCHPFWMPQGDTVEALLALLQAARYHIVDEKGHQVSELAYGDYLAIPVEHVDERQVRWR